MKAAQQLNDSGYRCSSKWIGQIKKLIKGIKDQESMKRDKTPDKMMCIPSKHADTVFLMKVMLASASA